MKNESDSSAPLRDPAAGFDTPAFYVQPVARFSCCTPADDDGPLVHPLAVIEQAATLTGDDEARTLVQTQAEAVFTATRRGRLIAKTRHRDHTALALAAGYRLTARLSALLARTKEWIDTWLRARGWSPCRDIARTRTVASQAGQNDTSLQASLRIAVRECALYERPRLGLA